MVAAEILQSLIDEASRTRETVEAKLHSAQQTVAGLLSQLEILRAEESAFRSALARRLPAGAAEIVQLSPGNAEGWEMYGRSEAVENAVRQLTRDKPFASPANIEALLASHGRDDDRDSIGGALAYLNRRGKILNVGRGQWVSGENSQGKTATAYLLENMQ